MSLVNATLNWRKTSRARTKSALCRRFTVLARPTFQVRDVRDGLFFRFARAEHFIAKSDGVIHSSLVCLETKRADAFCCRARQWIPWSGLSHVVNSSFASGRWGLDRLLRFKRTRNMPEIEFAGRTVTCDVGDNLRRVLLDARLPLYNGLAAAIHCRGLGTCGTCSVEIQGEVSPMTGIERWRLQFPPHRRESQLRLACQCHVVGDLKLTKHRGMWGHQIHPVLPEQECPDER